jgi:hypothetical protein
VRLTPNRRAQALAELLVKLGESPDGLRTRDLPGTPSFYGHRTLSLRQINGLLRESGRCDMRWRGGGMYTWIEWRLHQTGGALDGWMPVPVRHG